jgi:hypothetical protein
VAFTAFQKESRSSEATSARHFQASSPQFTTINATTAHMLVQMPRSAPAMERSQAMADVLSAATNWRHK